MLFIIENNTSAWSARSTQPWSRCVLSLATLQYMKTHSALASADIYRYMPKPLDTSNKRQIPLSLQYMETHAGTVARWVLKKSHKMQTDTQELIRTDRSRYTFTTLRLSIQRIQVHTQLSTPADKSRYTLSYWVHTYRCTPKHAMHLIRLNTCRCMLSSWCLQINENSNSVWINPIAWWKW